MTTLIVFSHLRWSFVYQRPQHLLSRLARDHRVLFVEEPLYAEGRARLERTPIGPNLELLVAHTGVHAPGFHDDQLSVVTPLLANHLRDHGIDDYVVWFYTPMALPLIAPLRPRAIVYDCMDELSAFHQAPRQLRQRESALLKIASLVLTGGPALYESKRAQHPNVHCLPSAVDAAHFDVAALDATSPAARIAEAVHADLPRPRLGFFGVIDERFDLGLLAACAAARPHWSFVMVGPVVKIDPAQLPRLSNIHWVGMQAYETLPPLMAGWDVCLMPFALNASTRYISPTKTLEYMAGGKPIVSTPVHDVVGLYGEVVAIASDADQFIAGCESALAEDPAARARRQATMAAIVQRSSWDAAAQTVRALLREALLGPVPGATSDAVPQVSTHDAAAFVAPGARLPLRVRHLVIGAGPTGLAAALHLGEKRAEIGYLAGRA